MPNVLVVDDDRAVLHMVSQAFRDSPISVLTAQTAEQALALLDQHPDVVLLDIVLRDCSGLDLVHKIRARDAKLPVIFITARGSSDTAIEAMKLGAYDYLLKPLHLPKLRELVDRALKIRNLMQVPVELELGDSSTPGGDELIGRSPHMQEVFKAIGRVAPQDVTVLIHGESGTGKELVARAIYHHGRRADKHFLAVNCAAIPEALLESELFGHEKGAFTSADQRRIGKFEQCSGGTIFLDEVGDMSPLVQSKVLRVLQEQRFERVGGGETIQTDVRIIAATNRDLKHMALNGNFREDLYYRLNGFSIKLPPLRERGEDVQLLISRFVQRFAKEVGKEVRGLSDDAQEILTRYPWPGNVRELQAVLRQALLQTTGPLILPEFLPEDVRYYQDRGASAPQPSSGMPASDLQSFVDHQLQKRSHDLYAETIAMVDRYVLARVLKHTRGNQSQAAKLLGITRGSLRNKLRSLHIAVDAIVTVDEDTPREYAAEIPAAS
ncbi:MAG TPA: sigma-54 dependent transcriptional regulator [Pirellulales bacterium]|nr:sigma-54 dependent transcriptional regulator [Pirellulales bacterium]